MHPQQSPRLGLLCAVHIVSLLCETVESCTVPHCGPTCPLPTQHPTNCCHVLPAQPPGRAPICLPGCILLAFGDLVPSVPLRLSADRSAKPLVWLQIPGAVGVLTMRRCCLPTVSMALLAPAAAVGQLSISVGGPICGITPQMPAAPSAEPG